MSGVLLACRLFLAGAPAWIADLSTAEAVLAATCAALAVGLAFNTAFLLRLLRQNGRLWARLETLEPGRAELPATPAVGEYLPSFQLPDLTGRPVDLDDLLDGERGLMLVFTSPDCGACDLLLPAIGAHGRRDADPGLVLVSVGDAETVAAKAQEHCIERVLLLDSFDFAYALGVTGAPGAVILDPYGRIVEEPVLGATALGARIGAEQSRPELVQVEGGA